MRRRLASSLALASALGAWLGCGGGEDAASKPPAAQSPAAPASPAAAAPAAPAAVSAAAADEAKQIFAMRCFTCHGAEGKGDGPGSAALEPKPRDFTDPAWQASVDDEHITKIVKFGGAAVGRSPAMPGNPDLMSKPEVVQALVAHVRGLGASQ